MSDKYVIGLTGNIACGKSTVAAILADLGAHVIDADKVVHQLMLPGQPVYATVLQRFGKSILEPNGSINRQALGAIVFTDPAFLAELEALSHPAVARYLEQWLDTGAAGIYVIEAIKLLEARIHTRCDAVWVVTCTRAQQVQRLRARNLDDRQVLQRIDAQPQLYLKLLHAHVVIDNSGNLETLRSQVQYAWHATAQSVN